MDQVTEAAVRRARAAGESLEQKLARNLERSLTHGHAPTTPVPVQPSLPTGEVDLVTLTLDKLHDLVYLAASSINRSSTTMSQSHAQDLAKRAAVLARSRAAQHDGHHLGVDPRG